MRPTLFGMRAAVFYAAVVGAYFAAPYVNLFFLLLAFLTALGLFGLLWSASSLGGVEVRPEAALVCMARSDGQAYAGEVRAGRRRRFDVGIRVRLAGRRGRVLTGAVAVLRAGERARVSVGTGQLDRGVYAVSRATLASTYPFGLVRRERPLEGPTELVVHPRPSRFGAGAGSASVEDWLRDLQADGAAGGDLQPASLRDHREGDSVRAIHWRATARRGRPVVAEWEGGSGEGIEIALDRRCAPEELEQALSDVAALVFLAREGKEVLLIRTQGHTRSFGEGHGTWDQALRLLAELQVLPSDGPAPSGVAPSTPVLPRRRTTEEAALV